MTPDARKQVAAAWAMLGEYFRYPLQDVVIGMYVEDVEHLDYRAVLTALRALRVESGRQRCPTPGDVLRKLAVLPPDASELAATIISSMSRFGYTFPDKARAHIGPVGWQVVELFGGWQYLCNTVTTAQIGTMRAQMRDALQGVLAREDAAAMTRRALPTADRQGMAGAHAQLAPHARRPPCPPSMTLPRSPSPASHPREN